MRTIALVLLATTAACHAMTTSETPQAATTLQTAAFSRYHTFAFSLAGQPPAGYDVSGRSLEAERRTHDLLVTALVRKGYVEDRGNADFLVRLSSGTRDVPPGDPETGYRPPSSEEAVVAIDLFDAASGSQVWHGIALADADPASIGGASLQGAVQSAIAAIPPQSSGPLPGSLATTAKPAGDEATVRQ
jgi:hypothetical protein